MKPKSRKTTETKEEMLERMAELRAKIKRRTGRRKKEEKEELGSSGEKDVRYDEEVIRKSLEGKEVKLERRVVDWDAIEIDYVHGVLVEGENGVKTVVYPTAGDLAKKYEVAKGTLEQKIATGKWKIKRDVFRERVNKERMRDLGLERTMRGSMYEGNALVKLEKLNVVAEKFIDRMEEILDNMEEGEGMGLKAQELVGMSKLIETNLKIARDIYGVPRDYEKVYEEAQAEFEEKARRERVIQAGDVSDLLRLLNAKTVEIEAKEVEKGE